ncbi:hypothetical protein HHI36_000908 [Cryptolaemus montrouzieri]|uniref:Uncharacterized protein n=1 Tax=Cryptolaemus montrouzieri TaxID=559131 RepID=A0ABD2P5W6_9CUCU
MIMNKSYSVDINDLVKLINIPHQMINISNNEWHIPSYYKTTALRFGSEKYFEKLAIAGTTGRNIRNLPCVSRKTNEKGICMFAINCLKANGTHLGTCIDKFYFGSCCHIPPVSDVENTIDSDIIPSREPPHRLSTLKPVLTTLAHGSTTSTNTELSTIKKEAIGLSTSTTQRPTTIPTKEEKTTTESKISTTFKVQNFTRLPSIAESRPDVEITTTPQKLTTFMSINGSPSTTSKFDETTEKASSSPTPLTKLTTRFSTKKPKPTLSINSSTVKSTTKKTITKITTKPTAKPSKATSRPKPTTTSSKPVKTSKPTKKPVVTVKVTTRKPSVTTKITKTPPTVTKKPTTTTTVKVTTRKTSLTTTESSTSYHNSTTAPLSTSTGR